MGGDFYLCSKPEGHGGGHADMPKGFMWGAPMFFASDPVTGEVVNTEVVTYEIPTGPYVDHPGVPEKLGVQTPKFEIPDMLELSGPEDWETFERLTMDLLKQNLLARCPSVCSVDGSHCIFPEVHATEINEYPAWHESDTGRSWRVGLADITPEEHTDTLNEFLDALEELGVPENIGVTVVYRDSKYTWRGYYWSVHPLHEHALN